MRVRILLLSALLASAACSEVGPRLVLTITTGAETDALTRAPAPTKVEIDGISIEGTVKSLARRGPATTFDLGPVNRGTVLRLRYRARDDAGKTLLFGESLPLAVESDEDEARVSLFVQRTGELARLPGALAVRESGALVDRLGERYVVVAAGMRAELFDLGVFTSRAFSLPRPAKTIVATARGLIAIDDEGAALVNLGGAVTSLDAPDGASFADVAGGAVVRGDDGVAWIVGAARERASDVVLKVDGDGSFTTMRLGAARARAVVAIVPERGVAVIGGSGAAPLIEFVENGRSAPAPYPAEPTAPGGAVALDSRRLLVLGGGAPARTFDLSCTSDCQPAPWGRDVPAIAGAVAPRLAKSGAVVALAPNDAGRDVLHVLGEASAPITLALRVDRSGARLAAGVAGSMLVVGGAGEIESYLPDAP